MASFIYTMKFIKVSLLIIAAGLLLLSMAYVIIDQIQEPYKVNEDFRASAPGAFLTLSRGNVHYQFHGPAQGELIVLIHGGGVAGCEVWSKTIPALTSAGYKVLCYDLYGRGYSDRPETIYDLKLIYNQFTELLDSLQIKAPFYLFGQSMGAMPATVFTAEYPQRVKKLVYIAPATLGGFSKKWYLEAPLLADLLMTFYWYPQSLSSQVAEFYRPEKADFYKKQLAYFMKFQGYKQVNLSTWLNTYTISIEERLKDIGANRTNTLLILGREDPYIPFQSQIKYQEAIPDLKVHIIEEAGHMPHYEKPKEVNAIILDFLKAQRKQK